MKIILQSWLSEIAGLVCALLMFGVSTHLNADEISQTRGISGWGNSIASFELINTLQPFALFDPALGNLTNVIIKIEGEMSASVWVENITEDAFGVTATPEVSIIIISRNGGLIAPGFTDSLRNSWDSGDHLEPNSSTSIYPGVDDRFATYTESPGKYLINPNVVDENNNPLTSFFMTPVVTVGASGTFIPDASSLPVAWWYNDGDHRQVYINQKIYVTLTYEYEPW